jgi:hypothetical protein
MTRTADSGYSISNSFGHHDIIELPECRRLRLCPFGHTVALKVYPKIALSNAGLATMKT